MNGHDEEEEDGAPHEPWNPEDDRAEKDYMKIAKQFMKEQLESLREMKAAQQKRQGPSQGHSQPLYQGMLAVGLPQSQTPNVLIRKIENGFLMTYNQAKELPEGGLHGAMSAGALPRELLAAIASAALVQRIEVFVKTPEDALPHLKIAMESMERISKMGGFTL